MHDIYIKITPFFYSEVYEVRKIHSLEIISSEDSPAGILHAEVFMERSAAYLKYIEVFADNYKIFEGNIDSHDYKASGGGFVLTIKARSFGAVLLDNEAMPRVFASANALGVFNFYLSRFGLLLVNPQVSKIIADFEVGKGKNVWEVFCGFCGLAYGIYPYLENKQVVVSAPQTSVNLGFANSSGGIKFTKARSIYLREKIISRAYLQDEHGYYSTYIDNSASADYNLDRAVYLHSNGNINLEAEAKRRIRKSMLDSGYYIVTVPGFYPARLYYGAYINEPEIGLSAYNLYIAGISYVLKGGEFKTDMCLKNYVFK